MKTVLPAFLLLSFLVVLNAHATDPSPFPAYSSRNPALPVQPYSLISPAINNGKPVLASQERLDQTLAILPDQYDPFLILVRTETLRNDSYLQTFWTPTGFYLEYQERDLDHHYASYKENLTPREVLQAFHEYLHGDDSWKTRIRFHKQDLFPDWSQDRRLATRHQSHTWASK